uniref:DUF4604 domain-containing protein n=1 Tax=Timema cristinae TaxID=61476 RepID=A0A7R9DE66_TIMCR|nr:unnamed protein product [Timema cristinae]
MAEDGEIERESLSGVTDEDVEDKDEEQPVVVVLKPGDLSAEEVAQLQVKEQEGRYYIWGFKSLARNDDQQLLLLF